MITNDLIVNDDVKNEGPDLMVCSESIYYCASCN